MARSSYSWSKRASPHSPLCLVSSSGSLELADLPAGISPSARKLDPRYDKSTAIIDSVSLLQPAWSLGQASNGLKIFGFNLRSWPFIPALLRLILGFPSLRVRART
ncbi:predicted protein [Histoplasma capsulatum G186AR]|uniref:Uncharacterized protein n=1 Tax=Ajellomyces capsulatus (strain G186AR / H82 / ATCC MYA-2454 / RMSCC 2432) TaxID=447093 RepID=C0NVP7_AJECG|nr:uncharacterized protein HCBG_07227 [Histoplasma capsulatum G186AR]EEH04586.1 predicted protein [Histoplasma capsulatum G186AR]